MQWTHLSLVHLTFRDDHSSVSSAEHNWGKAATEQGLYSSVDDDIVLNLAAYGLA